MAHSNDAFLNRISHALSSIEPTPPATPLRRGVRVFARLGVAKEKMEGGQCVWGAHYVKLGREFWCGTPDDIYQFLKIKESDALQPITQYLLTDPVSLASSSPCKFYIDFEFTPMQGKLVEGGSYTPKGIQVFRALSFVSGDDEFASDAVRVLDEVPVCFEESLARDVLNLLMESLTVFLCTNIKGQTPKDVMDGWQVSSSSYNSKISFHLVNANVVLEDHHNSLRHLVIEYNYWIMNQLVADLRACVAENGSDGCIFLFYFCGVGEGRNEDVGLADPAVYSKNQAFRLEGCVKDTGGEGFIRPLRPISVSIAEGPRYEFNTHLLQTESYTGTYRELVGSLPEFCATLLATPPTATAIRITRGNIPPRPYTRDYRAETCSFLGVRKPLRANTRRSHTKRVKPSSEEEIAIAGAGDETTWGPRGGVIYARAHELRLKNVYGVRFEGSELEGGEKIFHDFTIGDVAGCEQGFGRPNMTAFETGYGDMRLYCIKCSTRIVVKNVWFSNPVTTPRLRLPSAHTESVLTYIRENQLSLPSEADASGLDLNGRWPTVQCEIHDSVGAPRFCLNHPRGHQFINQYCDSEIDLFIEGVKYYGINALTAGGKTTLMKRFIMVNHKRGVRSLNPTRHGHAMRGALGGSGMTYLIIYHRRGLVSAAYNWAKRLGVGPVIHYTDARRLEVVWRARERGPLIVTTTLDSLYKVTLPYDVVFLDEAGAIRMHSVSRTIRPRVANVLAELETILKNASKVILLEHDLQWGTMDYFLGFEGVSRCSPVVRTVHVDIPPSPPKVNVSIDLARIMMELTKYFQRSYKLPVFIAATRAEFLLAMEIHIKRQDPHTRTLLVTSNTIDYAHVAEFIANPSDQSVNSKYDLVLVTHCINASVSIENRFKKAFWFLHKGLLTTRDEWQLTQRLRYHFVEGFTDVHAFIEWDGRSTLTQPPKEIHDIYFNQALSLTTSAKLKDMRAMESRRYVEADVAAELQMTDAFHFTNWQRLYSEADANVNWNNLDLIKISGGDSEAQKHNLIEFMSLSKPLKNSLSRVLSTSDVQSIVLATLPTLAHSHSELNVFSSARAFIDAVISKVLDAHLPRGSGGIHTVHAVPVARGGPLVPLASFRAVAKAIGLARVLVNVSGQSGLTPAGIDQKLKQAYNLRYFLDDMIYREEGLAIPAETAPYIQRCENPSFAFTNRKHKYDLSLKIMKALFTKFDRKGTGIQGAPIRGTFSKPLTWEFCYDKNKPQSPTSLSLQKVLEVVGEFAIGNDEVYLNRLLGMEVKDPKQKSNGGRLTRDSTGKMCRPIYQPANGLNKLLAPLGLALGANMPGVLTVHERIVRTVTLMWLVTPDAEWLPEFEHVLGPLYHKLPQLISAFTSNYAKAAKDQSSGGCTAVCVNDDGGSKGVVASLHSNGMVYGELGIPKNILLIAGVNATNGTLDRVSGLTHATAKQITNAVDPRKVEYFLENATRGTIIEVAEDPDANPLFHTRGNQSDAWEAIEAEIRRNGVHYPADPRGAIYQSMLSIDAPLNVVDNINAEATRAALPGNDGSDTDL